jgi:predicted flap endonuclease-1-like 5' DNA nuclease
MTMVTARNVSDRPATLTGKLVLPGETRQVRRELLEQAQRQRPGLFAVVEAQVPGEEPVGDAPAVEQVEAPEDAPMAEVEAPDGEPAAGQVTGEQAGEELCRVRGIGPHTAALLHATGIGTLADLAALQGWELTETARRLPVSESKLHSWAEKARLIRVADSVMRAGG